MMEIVEAIDVSLDTLDELWKQDDHKAFSEARMSHLFDIFTGALLRCIQKKMSEVDLWTGTYSKTKEHVRLASQICEKWIMVCQRLTEQFWKRFPSHPWTGDCYVPHQLVKLSERLDEVDNFILC